MPDRPPRFKPLGAPTGRPKDRRPSAARRGYDARWVKAREIYLAKNPLCVYCERAGRIRAATCIDHIEAHRGDMVKFWNVENWAASCKQCNDIKAARHEGGFGHKPKPIPDGGFVR